jgi:hemolysin activation/secretion protein
MFLESFSRASCNSQRTLKDNKAYKMIILRIFLPFSLVFFSSIMNAFEGVSPNASRYLPPYQDDQKLELPKYKKPETTPKIILPEVPKDNSLYRMAKGPSFKLKGVIFDGNTVFKDAQLKQVVSPFMGKIIYLSDIEEMRYQLTKFYTSQGYINSGAIIKPNQNINNAIVIFEIQEGRLGEIQVDGTQRLSKAYVTHRIWPNKEEVFNTKKLQENFQFLLNDPLIENMNGSLTPDIKRELADLDLNVTRANPYSLELILDNTRTPSTGSKHIQLNGTVRNLSGLGDSLKVIVSSTEGTKSIESYFDVPIDQYNSKLGFSYSKRYAQVIEEPLKDIDIKSNYDAFEIKLSHELWNNLNGAFILGTSLYKKQNHNTVLGEDFPLSLGEEDNGRSRVSAITLWQDYQIQQVDWVLAIRSTLNIGLDMLGSTVHSGDLADSKFLSWVTQLQYAKRIENSMQLILRTNVQLSNDKLLAMEKFSLGGFDTVRGYRENSLIRDNGYFLSAELHYALRKYKQLSKIELVPFIDYGNGWNQGTKSDTEDLLGIGMGIIWAFSKSLKAELYLAHDVIQASPQFKYDLQDSGIEFRVVYTIF